MAIELLAFLITGLCIGIIFDIFRTGRLVFKTPNFITYVEDILFWILSGLLFIYTVLTYTSGEIRIYMILLICISVIIYFLCISKYFIKVNSKMLIFIKSIITFLISPLKILKNFKKFSKNSGKWRILCYNVEIDI